MKRWLVFLTIILVLWALPIIPIERISLEELEPVELIFLKKENGFFSVSSDTGSKGTGKSVSEAMDNICRQAKGIIFLDTADFLVIDRSCVSEINNAAVFLRPAAGICVAEGELDLESLAVYLRSHPLRTTLGMALEGEEIPYLIVEEEMMLVQ